MSSTSTALPVLFVRPRLTRMSLLVLLTEIRYSKSSCPGFLPRNVTVENDPRLLESLLLTDGVTAHPEGSSPGRKWTLFRRIGVPFTSADHRQAAASTVTRRLLVSILIGDAASAGRNGSRMKVTRKPTTRRPVLLCMIPFLTKAVCDLILRSGGPEIPYAQCYSRIMPRFTQPGPITFLPIAVGRARWLLLLATLVTACAQTSPI